MINKAIVKKTGEILDVERSWIVKKMSIKITTKEDFDFKDQLEKIFGKEDTSIKEGENYILSDGKRYISDELIIGLDNIRNYKINQINEKN
jgi:hypothetical protein